MCRTKNWGNIYYNITTETSIDLVNKQIIAVNVRSGSWIDNLQFLILDPAASDYASRYSWTQALGGQGGESTSINLRTVASNGYDFQITAISGSTNFIHIRTLVIQYSYNACNPPVTDSSLLPSPTLPSLF